LISKETVGFEFASVGQRLELEVGEEYHRSAGPLQHRRTPAPAPHIVPRLCRSGHATAMEEEVLPVVTSGFSRYLDLRRGVRYDISCRMRWNDFTMGAATPIASHSHPS